MVELRNFFKRFAGNDAEYEYESVTIAAHYSSSCKDEKFLHVSNLIEFEENGFSKVEFKVLCDGLSHTIKKNGSVVETVKKGVKPGKTPECSAEVQWEKAYDKIKRVLEKCDLCISNTRGCPTIIGKFDKKVYGRLYLSWDCKSLIIYPVQCEWLFYDISKELRRNGFDVDLKNKL